MIEFDPSKNLELSQESLGEAMHDLAEELILKGETMKPLTGEFPPRENAGTPYQFSHELPCSFAREVLLDEDDIPQFAEAAYIMEHRLDNNPIYPETYEAIVLSWSYMLGHSGVRAEQSIMISYVKELDAEYYLSEASVEYLKMQNGEWRIVDLDGYRGHDMGALLDKVTRVDDDFDIGTGKVDLNDIERIHKAAGYIRAQTG